MEENIYEFLGLTPKDSEAKVRAELDAQIKKWHNQMTRQLARAKAKLAVLKKFKADLDANPNMLKEHADKYASLIAKKKQEQEKAIREEAAIYVLNGEIEETALAELARKNTAYTKDEILAIIGAKVKQKKEFKYKETGRGKDMDPTLFKRVCEELAKAKKRDLYDFLCVPPSAPASLIEKIANEKYAENQNKPASDEKAVINILIGYCKTLLLKEDARADYDYTCGNQVFVGVKTKIERIAVGSDRIIRPEQYKVLLEECTRNGMSYDKAEYLIHKTAETNKVTIVEPADNSSVQMCRFCGSLNTKGAKVCKTCGLPVVVICPKCGRESSDHEELICVKCGFVIGDFPKADALIKDAQTALKYNNVDEATRCIESAATIWPTHPMLSELQILIHNRTQEQEKTTKNDSADPKSKKYDVFISYSRKDFDEVSSILETIKTAIPNLSYWFDINGIESGDEFEDKIISAIDNSSYVLFALSENSIQSRWTKDEVMYAKNTEKKVIPILLKGAQMKGWFLFKFGRIDCIDSTNTLQMEKLLQNLSDWTGKDRVDFSAESAVERTSEQLCPCGSGKLFKDCHGRSAVDPIVSQPVERIWKVGDYYNVDGKEGVVFWVDETGKHGKIVSLDQAKKLWCTDDEYRKGLTGVASDKYDGMKNLQSIQKISDWRNKYPAFAWCADHGDGWYLPAIKELELLLLNEEVHDAVHHQIASEGIAKLISKGEFHLYWSSTERREWFAWSVDLYRGITYDYGRLEIISVRAVSAF